MPPRGILGGDALEALGDVFSSFRSIPTGLDVPVSASAAVRLALEQASRRTLPFPQDRAAVELLGWLELHLDDAPVTIMPARPSRNTAAGTLTWPIPKFC